MVTKWRFDVWNSEIAQVEVVSETAHFITVRTTDKWRREIRQKKGGKIFDTFAEAKAALIAYLERCCKHAEWELQRTLEKIQNVNAMQKPPSE